MKTRIVAAVAREPNGLRGEVKALRKQPSEARKPSEGDDQSADLAGGNRAIRENSSPTDLAIV